MCKFSTCSDVEFQCSIDVKNKLCLKTFKAHMKIVQPHFQFFRQTSDGKEIESKNLDDGARVWTIELKFWHRFDVIMKLNWGFDSTDGREFNCVLNFDQ